MPGKIFYLVSGVQAHISVSRIKWRNQKGGRSVEHPYPPGDIDDLIYQDEWTASER